MTTINIDNIEYDTDKLSDDAKAQLVSLQFCDQELARLQAQAAANIALSAIDSTATQTDKAPSVMKAKAIETRMKIR